MVIIEIVVIEYYLTFDKSQEFTAEFRFIQEWIDTRLAFDKMLTERNDQLIDWVYMADDQLLQLWVPDTFFQVITTPK